MFTGDTIVAISSSVGPAARMIVRLSGPGALNIAHSLGVGPNAAPGSAVRCILSFCDLSLPAWAYIFHAPRSYTGEDLVEFHIPGSPVLEKLLLEDLLRRGARAAEPGEFTAQAYFNGRMNLAEAEGVAATISAGNEQELSAARQLMSGELSRRLVPIMDRLTDTLALVEVGIDFTEEDVTFLPQVELRRRVEEADEGMRVLLAESARFERLSHEPQVVLVGRPNAGKSTLLNALAGRERAVVSPIAGTTRDALSAEVFLKRGVIQLVDVAGIESETTGEIDEKMQEHARRMIESADVIAVVQDVTDTRPPLELPRYYSMIVRSKADLRLTPSPGTPGEGWGEGFQAARSASNQRQFSYGPHPNPLPEYRARGPEDSRMVEEVFVSARTGDGLHQLKALLDQICFGQSTVNAALALNVRHVQAIESARAALGRLLDQLDHPVLELISLELRESLDALGSILGRVTPDDLLGRIFSGFCIGK